MLKKAASRAADALYEGKLEKAKLFRVVRGMHCLLYTSPSPRD